MTDSSEKTSKLISYWLRHKPEDAGLTVDDFGWTSIDQLLIALYSRNIQMDVQKLLLLNNSSGKVRWEFDLSFNRVRATHGHSIAITLDDRVKFPPETLYHGTALKNILKIGEQGLNPMNRQFVHLSETIETAIGVGRRHGKPILIEVETQRLIKDGWKFYQTSDSVWLTLDIPVRYLSFRPWFPITNIDDRCIDELKREIGNRSSHFLFPHLNSLKMVWQSAASDDTLFQDQKTGECFMVHLTYTKKEQEIEGWPYIEKYQTIEDWFDKGLWNDQQYFYDLK